MPSLTEDKTVVETSGVEVKNKIFLTNLAISEELPMKIERERAMLLAREEDVE